MALYAFWVVGRNCLARLESSGYPHKAGHALVPKLELGNQRTT